MGGIQRQTVDGKAERERTLHKQIGFIVDHSCFLRYSESVLIK